MPRQSVFEDSGDTFFINDRGSLAMRNDNGAVTVLVTDEELEDFSSWLTDEIDTINAKKAEEQSAMQAANAAYREITR